MDKYEVFFKNYLNSFSLLANRIEDCNFKSTIKLINECKNKEGKLIFVGNGGSASIASHLSMDFTNAAKIRSINFNEANLLTCFSNDYGYEKWVVKALESYSEKKDLVILISSSGESQNIINGADFCINNNIDLVTYSGFDKNNRLRKKGVINFWVDSTSYNYVEMIHHLWLVSIVDYFKK